MVLQKVIVLKYFFFFPFLFRLLGFLKQSFRLHIQSFVLERFIFIDENFVNFHDCYPFLSGFVRFKTSEMVNKSLFVKKNY